MVALSDPELGLLVFVVLVVVPVLVEADVDGVVLLVVVAVAVPAGVVGLLLEMNLIIFWYTSTSISLNVIHTSK